MVWSSLGSVNANAAFTPFNVALIGNELIRLEVSLLGENIYSLKRLDFVETYFGGLTRHALSLPVKNISVIQEFLLPEIIGVNGFSLRTLSVKHNKFGLADSTVVLVEAFRWLEAIDDDNIPVLDGGVYG